MVRLAAGLLALTVSLGGASASAQIRRPITQADSGKTFRISRGETAVLRLSGRWVWSEPSVGSRAIDLSPVYYFVYPGFQEWTIRADRVGSAKITALGRREGSPARHFRVTLLVTR